MDLSTKKAVANLHRRKDVELGSTTELD